MTSPILLQVAAPALAYPALAGGYAALEQPLGVLFPPVTFPDGSAVVPDELRAAQAHVVRRAFAGAPPEVWDGEAKTWKPLAAIDLLALTGIPLLPPKTAAGAWEGLLVCEKDASGLSQLTAASGSFPEYRLRGAFRAQRGTERALGVGPESAAVMFAAAADAKPFQVELSPDPDAATSVRFVLKAGGQPLGSIEIDAASGSAVVGLSKLDAAGNALSRVELSADGSVRLLPAAGKTVVIAGDLVVDRVSYVRSSDNSRRDL